MVHLTESRSFRSRSVVIVFVLWFQRITPDLGLFTLFYKVNILFKRRMYLLTWYFRKTLFYFTDCFDIFDQMIGLTYNFYTGESVVALDFLRWQVSGALLSLRRGFDGIYFCDVNKTTISRRLQLRVINCVLSNLTRVYTSWVFSGS